jgi:hypothetical protein
VSVAGVMVELPRRLKTDNRRWTPFGLRTKGKRA